VKRHVYIRELNKQRVVKDITIDNVANNSVKRGCTACNNCKRLFNNLLRKRLERKLALGLQSVELTYYSILSHVAGSLKIEEENKRDVRGYSEDLYRQYKDKSGGVSQEGLVIKKSGILLGKDVRKRSEI
jgi:hypothetical protein